MKELSRIASAVQASTTMAIDAMFKQMKADGVDVIGFGAGEPDFNTPDNIKAAGIAAIEQNITRYTPAAGTVEQLLGKTIHGVEITNDDVFADAFLKYGLVAVVPGSGFGAPNFVRWSYATSMENIKEGLDRLEKFLAE